MLGGLSYVDVDENKNLELYEALKGGEPIEQSVEKPSIKILVENGTNRTGLAGRAKAGDGAVSCCYRKRTFSLRLPSVSSGNTEEPISRLCSML